MRDHMKTVATSVLEGLSFDEYFNLLVVLRRYFGLCVNTTSGQTLVPTKIPRYALYPCGFTVARSLTEHTADELVVRRGMKIHLWERGASGLPLMRDHLGRVAKYPAKTRL